MLRVLMVAMLLALGACGTGTSDGGEGVAAVQPSRVSTAELRAAVSDPRLVRFYQARAWAPAWNREAAAALVTAIREAPRHALNPDSFLADVRGAEQPVAREAGLSLAALTYAEALARGRVDPTRLRDVPYTVARPDPDLAAGLNQALQQGEVTAWLAGLAPQDDEYRMLSEAYLGAIRANGGRRPAPIPEGDAIRPGGADPRVPAIASALRASGYLEPPRRQEGEPAPPAGRYTADMVAAVRQLQADYGIEPDGLIGAETLAALNGGDLDRRRTLAVNLERRRWLRRDPPATRIDVNTAAAELTYWRDGRVSDRRRVVVGQPDWPTPQLGSPIFRLAANPTWTVPRSIQEEEILPKGAAYMRRNNMVRRDGMIVQLSGPENALGLVKFDMKNDEAIYLHDTPAKALFDSDDRHASHGCIRVQDALGFAERIAADAGVTERWQRALATGEETFVNLPREVPVRLLYHTAWLDGGRIRFRDDAYGWDDDVAVALGFADRPRRVRVRRTGDIGP